MIKLSIEEAAKDTKYVLMARDFLLSSGYLSVVETATEYLYSPTNKGKLLLLKVIEPGYKPEASEEKAMLIYALHHKVIQAAVVN